MTVKCEECDKEMSAYPFKCAKLCLKCSLELNFERLPVHGIVQNRDVELRIIVPAKRQGGIEID